ncbi:ABC transporter ATP-binding protein [Oceanidesulfovibrio marinus]|uniref:ABC transporter ATP-binding protein n=1 Tax=Oceanidesulfovibrio marinus TaxID=370038 RepID=A0ABX6NCV2_9BACT|nr:ABC transporter ATP-binding protein [Oceanidesulfovibrio marinus]QJT08431.1 ABC transporter ATP-binding protein [Oceanidesulfovibrio marinus]
MAPIVTIEDLKVSFISGQSTVEAVKGVSIEVERGTTHALVGESGSGKSVTALSILRLLNPRSVRYPTGRILFEDQEMLTASDATLRHIRGNKVGVVFQEPMSSLNPLHTVERQIGEVLKLHNGMSGNAARKRIIELLDHVGIREPEERLSSYPHQLSGGQRQRVMIAMAVANEPELLIADEPTTALDVTVQRKVMELLERLRREMGMTMLLITHDLSIVRRWAERVSVMRHGEIVEHGSREQIFEHPEREYTRMLMSTETGEPPEPPQGHVETVLSCDDLKVWFPIKKGVLKKTVGNIKAVDGVSIDVKKGLSLGLVGESGSGKTTLGQALLRLNSSDGPILFHNTRLDSLSQKEMRPFRRKLQVVFQDPFGSLSPRLTVEAIVEEGMKVQGVPQEQLEARVVKVLEEVGMNAEDRHRYPHEFSGGQRQRIAIARGLVLDPEVLVLDEPTSSLDRSVQFQVLELLRRLQAERGLAYLFITHDLKLVQALCHEVVVMRAGQVVEHGPTRALFDNPQTDYTRELVEAAFLKPRPRGEREARD